MPGRDDLPHKVLLLLGDGLAGDQREIVRGAHIMPGAAVPLGIGVRHGWRKAGEPMLVTASDGNRIYTLDDQPALDMYLKRLGAEELAHGIGT